MPESSFDGACVGSSHDHRYTFAMRLPQAFHVLDALEDERPLDVERALERQLGDAAAGGAEPPLSHSSIDSPGSGEITSTPGASSRN